MLRITRGAVFAALMISASASGAADFLQPLPEEPVPTVTELPERYPDSWVFVHDLHFNSLPDGRAAIVDVGAENRNLLGQVPVAQFGNIVPSTTRGEIYVAETFYSRLTRGERTDVITIWDTKTLAPKDEIVLPGGKRGLFVTLRNSLQLTNGEKWALVFNFTPGSSVTVVDLDGRKVLSDIDLPGCSLVYPTGPRGFTSLVLPPRHFSRCWLFPRSTSSCATMAAKEVSLHDQADRPLDPQARRTWNGGLPQATREPRASFDAVSDERA